MRGVWQLRVEGVGQHTAHHPQRALPSISFRRLGSIALLASHPRLSRSRLTPCSLVLGGSMPAAVLGRSMAAARPCCCCVASEQKGAGRAQEEAVGPKRGCTSGVVCAGAGIPLRACTLIHNSATLHAACLLLLFAHGRSSLLHHQYTSTTICTTAHDSTLPLPACCNTTRPQAPCGQLPGSWETPPSLRGTSNPCSPFTMWHPSSITL